MDPARLAALLSGSTALGDGPIWLLTLLRLCSSEGCRSYQAYFDGLPLQSVGAKAVLRMFDSVQVVIDGGGLVPDFNACTIVAYPSPAAMGGILGAYPAPLHGVDTYEVHAFDGAWNPASSKAGLPAQATGSVLDMDEVRRLANAKDKQGLAQINGNPKVLMRYLQDMRFAMGRVWQLNLLKLEANPFYAEYGKRASRVITNGGTGGQGGIQFAGKTKGCYTLAGATHYDFVAAMQYPNRDAFIRFAMSQTAVGSGAGVKVTQEQAKAMAGGEERKALRTAGLAVQALICLGPDSAPGAIADPAAPSNIRAKL